ncbi:MAG: NifB/NifX family molybdenum-iron cluster-binding protein [Candidatus Freyarchaeota archaeon]|nr:NifB/NifX family molybdenum-iron cluster-binding protein [Candidatus Jordarchaeia archaeon]
MERSRIVVPVFEFVGEESVVCDHFGRAPAFAVVDVSEDGKILSIKEERNVSEHFGGMGKASELVARLSPDVLVVKGIGSRAISMFESMGVRVASCDALTLKDVIKAYLERRLFGASACRDAHHSF